MSDTNRVQLAYVAETAFGVQKTGSALQILRYTGESLKQDSGFNESNEIRTDRQTPSVRRTRIETSGAINFELSYGSYDPLLRGALLADADWTAPVTVGPKTTVSASAVDNSFSDSANGFGTLAAHQWVYVSGWTGANIANNGFYRISSVAAGKIVVTGKTVTTASAGDTITIVQGAYLVPGTTLTTYNIERLYADLTSELSLFKGQAINGWSLNMPQEGPITGSLDFIGANEVSLAASGGTGYTAATTTEIMTSLDLTNLFENQAAMTVLSFSMNYANNLRTRLVCGNNGVVSIGKGRIPYQMGIELKIARLGNPQYQEALRTATESRKALLAVKELSDEQRQDLQKEVVARTILLDWRGVEDDNGNPVPYSPEVALSWFRDPELWRLYNFILMESLEEEHYRKAALEDASKN